MISHYLTQIYQQQVLNESATIPDDVRLAMYENMTSVNQLFYRYASGIKMLLSDEPLSEEVKQNLSTTKVEYACNYALKKYNNIDVAAQIIFDVALNVLKQGQDKWVMSWWGYVSVVERYMQYCIRFDIKPVLVRQFIVQLLQKDNINALKTINKWEVVVYAIDKYLQKSTEIDEQVDALIKNEVQANVHNFVATKELMSVYYKHYARIMKKPCDWIDAMVCNADDSSKAKTIFDAFSWIRTGVAPQDQQTLYDLTNFMQQVCGKKF